MSLEVPSPTAAGPGGLPAATVVQAGPALSRPAGYANTSI